MHNPVAPTTPLTIDGKRYELLFDFAAVSAAEEVTGRPLLTGLRKKDIETPTIALVWGMLYACMLSKQPDTTYVTAKALVNRKNLAEVWIAVVQAWTKGLVEPGAEEEVVAEHPTSGQK